MHKRTPILLLAGMVVLSLFLMSMVNEITGQAYSRSLGRSTGKAFAKDCTSNEECPAGTACRTYGVYQRFRKRARTACMSICEDPEKNRIPFGIQDALRAEHDLDKVSGFNPFKSRPTYYRPRNSFETFGYTSDCKDDATLVEPFCVNGGSNQATVATIEIDCASIGSSLKCIKDDNLFGTCGQEGGEIDEEGGEITQGPSLPAADVEVSVPETIEDTSELEEESEEEEVKEPSPEPEESFEVPTFDESEEEEESFEVPEFDEDDEDTEEELEDDAEEELE